MSLDSFPVNNSHENTSKNKNESGVSLEDVRKKSTSPYLDIKVAEILPEYLADRREVVEGLLQDEEGLMKLYLLGKKPDTSFRSPEFQEYLNKLSWIQDRYHIKPFQFESLSSYSFFTPNDLSKDSSVIETLQKIHEARHATEKMIRGEASARNYMIENSPEIGEILSRVHMSYSHPDHYNFAVHRNGKGSYTVLLSAKDFDFTKKAEGVTLFEKIKLAHEMYHAVFDELVVPESVKNTTVFEKGRENSFAAFTEGFATIMEMHLNRSMQENPDKYELSVDEVSELQKIQKERLIYLRDRVRNQAYLHYWEGVSRIFHKIIKEEGVKGAIAFCKELDLQKLMDTDRDDDNYIKLLEKNDPDAWLDFLGKKQ